MIRLPRPLPSIRTFVPTCVYHQLGTPCVLKACNRKDSAKFVVFALVAEIGMAQAVVVTVATAVVLVATAVVVIVVELVGKKVPYGHVALGMKRVILGQEADEGRGKRWGKMGLSSAFYFSYVALCFSKRDLNMACTCTGGVYVSLPDIRTRTLQQEVFLDKQCGRSLASKSTLIQHVSYPPVSTPYSQP